MKMHTENLALSLGLQMSTNPIQAPFSHSCPTPTTTAKTQVLNSKL